MRSDHRRRTSPWTGQRQRWVRLHALVQRGHSQKLPLVNAELGDVFICFHILRCPLLDSCPWVEVEHLVEDEWALQAAFAGSICQQVGLHLLQAGQQRATGTYIYDPAAVLRLALPANGDLDRDGLPLISRLTVLSAIHCSTGFTLDTSEVYLSDINQRLRNARHVRLPKPWWRRWWEGCGEG